MAKTKRTAQMLTKTDELILKLQARKLELTRQLGEQQAKSERLAVEASVLAARVAAEAVSPSPLPTPPLVPAEEADPLQDELDALDVFMATEGTEGGAGVARKPSGDSLLPAPKLARRDGASPPTSPAAVGHQGL
jgi:hypothetical protein